MKLLLDADVPRSFLPRLRDCGHDVSDVRDISKTALKDAEIFAIAQKEGRTLITRDLDFSNILMYPPAKSCGIIVLRTHRLSQEGIFRILLKAIQSPQKQLQGTLIIAQKDRLRFHR